MNDSLPQRDIVLLGAGHTNAHIIRMWRMKQIADVRLTCVSDYAIATYSGMLAGTLAGQYQPSEMEIDLVRLCASCGVRFVQAQATGLDLEVRRLLLADRPPVKFDLLSIGIGSRPAMPPGNQTGLSIKPMQTFLPRLRAAIDSKLKLVSKGALRITIVGGGAAGVEIACCLQEFLKQHYAATSLPSITLVEGSDAILKGMPDRSGELALRELQRRGIQCRTNSRVVEVGDDGQLVFEEGESLPSDLVIWATSARPPALLGELGLPLDQRGFLQTHGTLQSTGSDNVFVVGDSGAVEGEDYAKAGVYAVRQAPVLWENLRRKIAGQPLQRWRPQAKFLSLIGTGDDRAILTYRGWSFHTRASWRLKDWIDTRFMAKYQSYDPPQRMPATKSSSFEHDATVQCGGCGSKAAARVLQRSLPRLQQQPGYDHVLLGLDSPDDIALLTNLPNRATAVSTDFFTAFVDDPYLVGRVAALNALSDLYAKGATPRSALTIAVLPPGPEVQQTDLLDDLLAGAVREFGPAEVAIVGGHSIVGPKLSFGFTILGDCEPERVLKKSTVSAGDWLVLTKPLGTGVLLAAHMQAACRAQWWTPLIESMLQSNRDAAITAHGLRISAATDVTGFGLAVHLQEMLNSTGLAAELSLQALPLLPGAEALLKDGFKSTLAPSNCEQCPKLRIAPELREAAATKILFDPQTSGGLLLGVPEGELPTVLASCGPAATKIGRVVENPDHAGSIELLP